MSNTVLLSFADADVSFLCRACACDSTTGRFSCEASLARLAGSSPDVAAMRKQASTESLLMKLYDVRLPPSYSPPSSHSCHPHQPSVDLLGACNPWILSRYTPAIVGGDGNCFFRSLSFTLYGTEAYHVLLRLLCVFEVLQYRQLYDTSTDTFYAPFKCDQWLQLPNYNDFVTSLSQLNSYCDMLSVLAASAVTQKTIQTLWPLQVNPGQLSPLTKLVVGRGVSMCRRPVQILWTVSEFVGLPTTQKNAHDAAGLNINHFVPLIEVNDQCDVTEVVDCRETEARQDGNVEVISVPTDSHSSADFEAGPCNGIALPANQYLSFAQCISLLCNVDESQLVSIIPNGVKSNMYFIVSAADNEQRITNGKRRLFYDDCGAWANVRGYNSVIVNNNPKELYEKNGQVCDRKRVDGKDTLVPLEPQPERSCVRKVTRYYHKLKRCDTYTKRITLVSGSNGYLCEYLGTFPDATANHGNCTLPDGSEYVRTNPKVIAAIQESCTKTKLKPKQIYTDLNLDSDESTCARNLRQVQNVSAMVNAQLIATKAKGTNNLADEMLTLCSEVVKKDFVRNVSFASNHAPCVVLYTTEQLSDVKRFCGADAPDNVRSVLSVDRTFNVSSLFLTLTVFKNNSVLRRSTMQPPVFMGPMFLHGDGQFMTYLTFFMFLRGVLDSSPQASELKLLDGIITGSDEEAALVKAMQVAFPDSKHLYCVLHCQDNVREHMIKTGLELKVRQETLRMLFGESGLALSVDEIMFEDRRAAMIQYVNQYCPSVEDYLCTRVIPKLLSNCRTMWDAPWLGPQRWTNNSCESANNLLKVALDWKPARLTDLVQHLHDMVRLQYKCVQRALIGQGDFVVSDDFANHRVPFCRWQTMSEDKRTALFNAFLSDSGHRGSKKVPTVVSSDGSLTVQGTNKVARKPGQTKRPRGERTTKKKVVT